MMKVYFLGTGTSTGVPQINCNCKVCTSSDEKDNRMRSSVLVSYKGYNILIDCGPDFRTQILKLSSPHIDAILLTHSHYDHVGGIDDLRPYTAKCDIPIYCKSDVLQDIKTRLPYCFKDDLYPGVPILKLHEIGYDPFRFKDIIIEPIDVMHYKLPILGFKIGNLAYITDAKTISDESINKIKNIDTLIINALRYEPHMSHMCVPETLDVISRIQPRISYITHMSHDIGLHSELKNKLPNNVIPAYDSLEIEI